MAYTVPNPVASREKILGFIAEGLSQKEACKKYGIDQGYLSYQCKYFNLKMIRHVIDPSAYLNKKYRLPREVTDSKKSSSIAKGAWV